MTAAELIAALRAGGMTYERIAQSVGRNSSLIGQIARGKKPGANLVSALQTLLVAQRSGKAPRSKQEALSVSERLAPAARLNPSTGAPARVRTPAKLAGHGYLRRVNSRGYLSAETYWTTSQDQVRRGARSLAGPIRRAGAAGWRLAYSIWFAVDKVNIRNFPYAVGADWQPFRGAHPGGPTVEVKLGAAGFGMLAADVARLVAGHGGDVVAALLGDLDDASDASDYPLMVTPKQGETLRGAVVALEVRTFLAKSDPRSDFKPMRGAA